MKDVVIKGKVIRRELFIYLACLVVACLLNVYAIATYSDTTWKELYSVWYALLPVSLLIYVLTVPVRLAGLGLWKLVRPLACRKCAR